MRFPYIIRSTRCFPEHRIKRRGIEIENGRRRIAFSLFFVVAAGLLLTAAAAAAADFPSSSFPAVTYACAGVLEYASTLPNIYFDCAVAN